MAFRPTDHLEPTNPEEVCGLLSKHGKHARIIAGGTAIYELAKRGLASEVKQLISLRRISELTEQAHKTMFSVLKTASKIAFK